MDSLGSPSADETRPLNPNGAPDMTSALSPDSIRPPLGPSMNDDDEVVHECGIRLTSVLQCLIIIFATSNIIAQILAIPGRDIEICLLTLDWAIFAWSILAFSSELRAKRQLDGLMPVISLTFGKKTFHLAGPRSTAPTEFPVNKSTHTALAWRNSIEVVLTLALFSLTLVSSVLRHGRIRYRAWFRTNGIETAIEVLHFFTVVYIALVLYLRAVEARKGYSAFFKFGIDRKAEPNTYSIRLPTEVRRK